MKSFARIYDEPHNPSCHRPLNDPYEVLTMVKSDFEGRSVQSSKFVVERPSERFKGLKASDFSLENQVAVGVALKPAFCSLSRQEIDYMIVQANDIKIEKQ